MKVSNAMIRLTERDILSMAKDYLDIEGLNIESIHITEVISIKGNYKKKIKIPFEAKIGIGNIHGNIVNVKLFSVNVLKIGILSSVKNLVMKKLLKDFSAYGIEVDKDTVTLDLDVVVKIIPYLSFKLNRIRIKDGTVEVEADEIMYSEKKEVLKIDKNSETFVSDKPSDEYSMAREKVIKNVPDEYEKLIKYAMIIPDITALFLRLFKDKRVTIKVKIKIAGVAAYLASPIDILPDFIPLIGKIDDVAIGFFGLNAIMNEVPEEIVLENWSGEENIILLTKEAVSYISDFVGVKNVEKLINNIKKIFKREEKKRKKCDDEKIILNNTQIVESEVE